MFEIERQVYIPHGMLLYLGEKAREFAATGTTEALVHISREGVNLRGEVLGLRNTQDSVTIPPRFTADFDDESGQPINTIIDRGAVAPCTDNDPED